MDYMKVNFFKQVQPKYENRDYFVLVFKRR